MLYNPSRVLNIGPFRTLAYRCKTCQASRKQSASTASACPPPPTVRFPVALRFRHNQSGQLKPTMKSPYRALVPLVLCLTLAACGDASKQSTGGARGVTSTAHKNDRDNDNDHNDDDGNVLDFGQAASATDRQVSVALVTRYFAAAAAANGAMACTLLAPLMAESVVEVDGHSAALRGSTCAQVMSKLFRLHHPMLVEKSAALKVVTVRILGNTGLIVLDFPEIPEVRQIGERRIDGRWAIFDLLDGIIE
jgi:hypothetical protein